MITKNNDNGDNNRWQMITKCLIIYFLSFHAVDDEEALRRKKTCTPKYPDHDCAVYE